MAKNKKSTENEVKKVTVEKADKLHKSKVLSDESRSDAIIESKNQVKSKIKKSNPKIDNEGSNDMKKKSMKNEKQNKVAGKEAVKEIKPKPVETPKVNIGDNPEILETESSSKKESKKFTKTNKVDSNPLEKEKEKNEVIEPVKAKKSKKEVKEALAPIAEPIVEIKEKTKIPKKTKKSEVIPEENPQIVEIINKEVQIEIKEEENQSISQKKKKKSEKEEKELIKEEVVKSTDEPKQEEPPKPNVRYSDEQLELFKQRILDARLEAIDELRMLRERLDDLTNYDFAEESMIYSMHMAEQGSEAIEKEKTYAHIQRINEYIKKLDEALQRIEDKTYGICRVCGCLIAKERLLAVPITTLSASYKIQKKCPEDGIDKIEPLKNM